MAGEVRDRYEVDGSVRGGHLEGVLKVMLLI